MGNPKDIEDLEDDLCEHCPLDEEFRGARSPHYNCEGCRCEEAYENYLEDFNDNLETMETVQDKLKQIADDLTKANILNGAIESATQLQKDYMQYYIDGSYKDLRRGSLKFVLTEDESIIINTILKSLILTFAEGRKKELEEVMKRLG